MNTRKFEYLETIRESIELGDYEELKDYVEDIRDRVRFDTDFEDIFLEINSGKYQKVISLIDDMIYNEMQEEFDSFEESEDEEEIEVSGEDLKNFSVEPDFEDDMKEEEITFESFDEEGYADIADDDNL